MGTAAAESLALFELFSSLQQRQEGYWPLAAPGLPRLDDAPMQQEGKGTEGLQLRRSLLQ